MLVVIDESGDNTTDEHRYVIAAACILDPAALPDLNRRLHQLVYANPERTRGFHWRREGHMMRESLLDHLAGNGAFAVVDRVSNAADQEHARAECLLRLFELCESAEHSVTQLMIESREAQPVNRGQNHLDHKTIVTARHRGLLRPKVGYGWYSKLEPVGWLADAIAGATLDRLRGEDRYLDRLATSAAWSDVVFVGEI